MAPCGRDATGEPLPCWGFPWWTLGLGAAPVIYVTVTAQAPQTPQQPSRLAQFGACVANTLKQTVPQTLGQFGHNLALSVEVGVPLGLGIGGAVLLSQPELLPAAPTVLTVATGQTVSTMAGVSITVFSVSFATDIVAAPAYCGANVLGF